MPQHKHEWVTLHEVYPEASPQAITIINENGEEQVMPFDKKYVEGTVGFEEDEPYRVEYCSCGEKRTQKLSASEAENLGIRTGRIVADTLTVVGRSEASG